MTVAISLAALAISVIAIFLSVATGRARDRRDLLLRLHEYLSTPVQQRGRRLVHAMSENNREVSDLTDEEYSLINSALASLDVAAMYWERRYMPRDAFLEAWAQPLVSLMRSARAFLAHRDALPGGCTCNGWPARQATTCAHTAGTSADPEARAPAPDAGRHQGRGTSWRPARAAERQRRPPLLSRGDRAGTASRLFYGHYPHKITSGVMARQGPGKCVRQPDRPGGHSRWPTRKPPGSRTEAYGPRPRDQYRRLEAVRPIVPVAGVTGAHAERGVDDDGGDGDGFP